MKYLQDIKTLPEPRKTFMEIMKVHNKEVPMANLLAYFFRNKEKHLLKNLFLKALLTTYYCELNTTNKNNISSNLSELYDIKLNDSEFENLIVKTEEPKNKDFRIDLLIVAKSFTICIEFKINHVLDNPLADYKKFMEERYSEKSKHIYIVLTPYSKTPEGKAKEFIDKHSDFKKVILSKFIKNVKEMLPNDYLEQNTYDSNYLKDFIQTIENREIRYKRSHILKELNNHIPKFEFHNNNQGGFLQYKNNSIWIKIRIKNKKWQIENWKDNKQLERHEILSNFKNIINVLNNKINF